MGIFGWFWRGMVGRLVGRGVGSDSLLFVCDTCSQRHMLWLELRPKLKSLVRIPTVTEEMKAQGGSLYG